jgi:hypothetical protein
VARKTILPLLTAMLSTAGLLSGCQSPKPGAPVETVPVPAIRNNCYSLLHQLLADQKNVSLLRFIKREHADVKELVKKIATHSAAGAKTLEEMAKHDPTVVLEDIRLPPGETSTREAIATTKKKALLNQKGEEFELTLLLTQTEALNYAWHLAKVAAENEPEPDRARALKGISQDMQNLYHEVFLMLLSKQK